MNIEARVAAWNTHYNRLAKEARLKDMDPASYERLVVGELLTVCDEDPQLAIAVFRHHDNDGGWMHGNPAAILEWMAAGDYCEDCGGPCSCDEEWV
jgi:hypothetical protein